MVEERCERYAAMLYPANAARNRALVNARTGAHFELLGVQTARHLSAGLPCSSMPCRALLGVLLCRRRSSVGHPSGCCLRFSPSASCCKLCFFRLCFCAEAILLVDVDFAVSRSLADALADEESYSRLMAMLHARCGTARALLLLFVQAGWRRGAAVHDLPAGGGEALRARDASLLALLMLSCPHLCSTLPVPCLTCLPLCSPLPPAAATPWCCPRLRRRTTGTRGSAWRSRRCARARSTW